MKPRIIELSGLSDAEIQKQIKDPRVAMVAVRMRHGQDVDLSFCAADGPDSFAAVMRRVTEREVTLGSTVHGRGKIGESRVTWSVPETFWAEVNTFIQ